MMGFGNPVMKVVAIAEETHQVSDDGVWVSDDGV
jgi:hypothetical protein